MDKTEKYILKNVIDGYKAFIKIYTNSVEGQSETNKKNIINFLFRYLGDAEEQVVLPAQLCISLTKGFYDLVEEAELAKKKHIEESEADVEGHNFIATIEISNNQPFQFIDIPKLLFVSCVNASAIRFMTETIKSNWAWGDEGGEEEDILPPLPLQIGRAHV